jgi:hypothetical protein
VTVAERFWAKVDKSGGPEACWPWTAGKSAGYGRVTMRGRQSVASRVSYELATGISPSADLQIDHLCKNPPCVNPKHLQLVTQRENIMRSNAVGAVNATKTRCNSGHVFDEKNTYLRTRPDGDVERGCRSCARLAAAARRARSATQATRSAP